MSQWHCYVGGQRYGPISEDDLRSWIQQGRVHAADLVWSPGMPDWVPAGSVPGLCPVNLGGVPVLSTCGVQPPGGTGGFTPNRDLMAQAREILRGRWGDAVLVVLVYGLLLIGCVAASMIGIPAVLVVGGPLELGLTCYFLALARRGTVETGFVFRGFRNFANSLVVYIVRSLFVEGLALAAAVPGALMGVFAGVTAHSLTVGLIVGGVLGGISMMVVAVIVQLGYSMSFFLLADNPRMGPVEPIFQSWRMMQGHKARLFFLSLRFLGWYLLCLLTCGIGLLWLAPYVATSFARFYDDLRQPAVAAAVPFASPVAPTPAEPLAPPTSPTTPPTA